MKLDATMDLLKSLEGELVYIICNDDYEILDYYTVKGAKTLFLTGNRCTVNIPNITSIQWIKDHKNYYAEKSYYAMVESTKEH